MLSIILDGSIVGLLLQIAIGPVFFFILNISMQNTVVDGLFSVVAVTIVDYIYIAPPQYRGLWIQTLQVIDRFPQWLAEDGWAVVQINPVEDAPVELKNLVRFDQRTYGGVMICFYMLRATYDAVLSADTPA